MSSTTSRLWWPGVCPGGIDQTHTAVTKDVVIALYHLEIGLLQATPPLAGHNIDSVALTLLSDSSRLGLRRRKEETHTGTHRADLISNSSFTARFGRGITQATTPIWFVPHHGDPRRNHHVGTRQGEPAPVYGHGLSKTAYERHQPEQTLLYQLVEAHYPALVDLLAQQGKSLPDHVHQEFESYLKCGRLEHGFLRVRCDKCHFERLVAFSCKKRGFCPSCGARRMAETAALLSDEVFPDVPLRQWVISFPFPLRYLFAAHPQAMGKVLGIVYRVISTHLIHKAGLQRKDGATGAVTLIQRFGSALNLNIHFHILLLDGVYVYRDNRPPRFQRIKAPDKGELEGLTHLISQRVGRCLERQGLLELDSESAWLDLDPAEDTDAMPQILGSSVSYRVAVGPQQGRKAFMIRTIRPLDRSDPALERVAKANGFSLHAGVSCEAHQKDKRERIFRYIARPPVAVPRLSVSSTGKVVYTLKTPYGDGTTQVAFEPVDFLARLAALVPKPRVNLTRYHGVLAPNHRWRGEVTPAKRGKAPKMGANPEVKTPIERHAAMTWTQRLKRVFNTDIETCGRCGGSLKVIACIEDQGIIDRILAHLREKEQDIPTLPLLVPPPRAPPETLPLFAGKESSSTALKQQGSH